VAGLAIRGLDLRSIDSGELTVKLPLHKGTFLVPTNHADAKTRVKEAGFVEVKLQVQRGPDGEPRVEKMRLAFDPPVTVLNPASSLQPATGPLAGVWNFVQDVAGDIHLTALDIGPDGVVDVDGTVDKPWPMKDQPLREAIPKGTFPRLDMKLSSIAGGKAIAEAAVPSSNPGRPPSLEALLQSMGAMTGEGTFGLSLKTKETTLSADGRGINLSGAKSRVELTIGGKVELDRTGTLRLEVPQSAEKELVSGLGSLDLAGRGQARLTPQGKVDALFDVRTTAVVDGVTGQVTAPGNKVVPITIGGADNLVVANTRVRMGDDGLVLENGDAKVKVRADLPEGALVEVEGNKVRLTGGDAVTQGGFAFGLKDANVRLSGQQISLDPETARPAGVGVVAVGVQTSLGEKALTELDYRLEPSGHLAVRPRRSEMQEILIPLNSLQQTRPFIVDPKGPAAGPVTSAAFKARITELTGARVTTNNDVKLLPTGAESHRERLALITGAKESISLQTFIFKDDVTGNETADALVAAAKRGVAVRVIIDGLGNVAGPDDLTREHPIYAKLKAGGVDLRIHGDPREHVISDIMLELQTNPELPKVDNLRELLRDPGQAAEVLQHLAQVAMGTRAASPETRRKVAELLERASVPPGESSASISSDRVAAIAAGDPVTAKELVIALRHLSELNFRWHEKYLVVDGASAITGGINIADEYLLGGTSQKWGDGKDPWRDADVLIRGDGAGDVHGAFARNWQHLTGEQLGPAKAGPAKPGAEVQVIQGHPRLAGDRHITNATIEALKALKPGDKAYIANAYFLPTGSLEAYKEALKDAAQRGVDVRIVTNSEGSTDMPALNWAALYPVEELLQAGVRIFERTGPGTIHTKAAVFGSELSVVGSWNNDNRSASLNSEGVALVYGGELGRQVEAMVLADMQPDVARELDLATVQARIRAAGPRNKVASLFADLM
jgi:phosphatidylserine/phosphatidylglycerophosphate/cardiolipin synthase-like enzyme